MSNFDPKRLDSMFSWGIHVRALDGYSATGEIARECGRDFDEFADAVARLAEAACDPNMNIADGSVHDLSGPSKIR